VLDALAQFPDYQRQFLRQTKGQHSATVLEAKLSHDLAYYRFFDEIAALAEKVRDLRALIAALKKLPHDATTATAETFLLGLSQQYGLTSR
jgi:predicted SprT family Zn-dependent metalloprotease